MYLRGLLRDRDSEFIQESFFDKIKSKELANSKAKAFQECVENLVFEVNFPTVIRIWFVELFVVHSLAARNFWYFSKIIFDFKKVKIIRAEKNRKHLSILNLMLLCFQKRDLRCCVFSRNYMNMWNDVTCNQEISAKVIQSWDE